MLASNRSKSSAQLNMLTHARRLASNNKYLLRGAQVAAPRIFSQVETVMTQKNAGPEKGELILRLRGVGKQFGAVTALEDIELDVHAGEVVALVGDNGAGKSTLVKVLAGVHQPTSGTIEYLGKQVSLDNPGKALEMGIATVFQDLALCENLDVVANLFLGHEISPW